MDALDPQEPRYQTPGPIAGAGTGNTFDPWSYRDEVAVNGASLTGYKVEAVDGGIGKVDDASHEVGAQCLVVDTGPWVFGKKVLLPAGTVNHIDREERKVYVDRTKDQIKSAPEFDPDTFTDPVYRDKVGSYYGDNYHAPGGPIPPTQR
ncbi:PRC-barrel domain-containing protein [Allorhizocola rhizosphaerae]|uniref:PRC-barrel domain-containing protein n=1 Tax=Allorhizocola rhizosphaerae TaxID=1872709 RepID=UPI00147819F9|nr:PRC-barrel domain-containing protein [Allorhizocola rhizosphaerae]